MAPSVPFRALLSVITTSNNPDLSGQRLRRIEVPALDGPHADIAANARKFGRGTSGWVRHQDWPVQLGGILMRKALLAGIAALSEQKSFGHEGVLFMPSVR
jgi:hypothetical protein